MATGTRIEGFRRLAAHHLERIAQGLHPGFKLTLVCRLPGEPESDIVVTADNVNDVIAVLKRRNV